MKGVLIHTPAPRSCIVRVYFFGMAASALQRTCGLRPHLPIIRKAFCAACCLPSPPAIFLGAAAAICPAFVSACASAFLQMDALKAEAKAQGLWNLFLPEIICGTHRTLLAVVAQCFKSHFHGTHLPPSPCQPDGEVVGRYILTKFKHHRQPVPSTSASSLHVSTLDIECARASVLCRPCVAMLQVCAVGRGDGQVAPGAGGVQLQRSGHWQHGGGAAALGVRLPTPWRFLFS
eukprot:5287834-Pleurochrysis_carterae.AAC.1